MQIRDRIKELKRIPAKDLIPHPQNWRKHPQKQHNIMKGILTEIGYADAILTREIEPGKYQIIDGHLRAEITKDSPSEMDVPILVLDVSEEEAKKILASFDPVSTLAETDDDAWKTLTADMKFECVDINELFKQKEPKEKKIREVKFTAKEKPPITCPKCDHEFMP